MQDEDDFPPDGTQAPGKVAQQATSLLYAGEHFDADSQNYYLRARWYDSLSGRFNRMDPFTGNNQDPQSLHKYLYAHCNPINNIDPTGKFSLVGMVVNMAITSVLMAILSPIIELAAGRIIRKLIPQWVLDIIDYLTPRAIIGGGNLCINAGAGKYTLGFGAGIFGFLEGLLSPRTRKGAIYGGWGIAVGWQGGAGVGFSGSVYGGLAYGASDSQKYTGRAAGVSIPISYLPKRLRTKIHSDITAMIVRNVLFEWDPGMFLDEKQWMEINKIMHDGSKRMAASIMKKGTINISWSWSKPPVVAITLGFGGTIAGKGLGGSITPYLECYQLLPRGDKPVPF